MNHSVESCYAMIMLKAYVGVASKQGLAIFQPERDDTLALVHSQMRRGIRRFGFWAVINDREAQSVQALVLGGHCREAMIALDRFAHELGPISSPTDPSPFH